VESYADGRIHNLHYGFIEDGLRYEPWPDFTQPALVFHGRADDIVPVEYSVEFARKHPNVDLRVMASGHDLVDVLDEMWMGVERFLA
jgi:pimeloyl-ACP methyl ester carboxylesterase